MEESSMPRAVQFPRDRLPFIPCRIPEGETRSAWVISAELTRHMVSEHEIVEDIRYHWTALYDEIRFIHEGGMRIGTGGKVFDCGPGDIVWLPEGVSLDYDITGRRCAYFYALYPFDWAARRGIAEP